MRLVIANIFETHPNGWMPIWWLDGLTNVLENYSLCMSFVLLTHSSNWGGMGRELDFGKNYGWVINRFVFNTKINLSVIMVLGSSPPSTWNLNFIAIFWTRKKNLQRLLLSIGSMKVSPSTANSRGWSLSSTSLFIVKSFYLALSITPITLFHSVKILWSSKASPKVKAFAWSVANRKANTNDLLKLRQPYGSLNPLCCTLCKDGESIDHLFLHCLFTIGLWHKLFSLAKNWCGFLQGI